MKHDDTYDCQYCGAFLTDNVKEAYRWVGGKTEWRCKECGVAPFCGTCGVLLNKKNRAGYCEKHPPRRDD